MPDLPVHLVLATDASYLPWCAVAVRSALCASRAPTDIVVHVLVADDVVEADVGKLSAIVEGAGATAVVHAVDWSLVASLPSKDTAGGLRICWLRTVLPALLADLDRVVYLDCDVLVRHDLADLWAEDLGGAPVGAVLNVTEPSARARLVALGLDPFDYFNAGVLLVDLHRWRAEDLSGQVQAQVAAHGSRLAWFDQDALNLVARGRWHRLHPRWNTMNSFWGSWRPWAAEVHGEADVVAATADPAVLHFEGPMIAKPWHVLNAHPWRDEHRALHATTPWRHVGLGEETAVERAVARLPAGWHLPLYVRLLAARELLGRSRIRRHSLGEPPVAPGGFSALDFDTSDRSWIRDRDPRHPLAYLVGVLPDALARRLDELVLGPAPVVVDLGCADRPFRTLLPAGAVYVGVDLPGNADADVSFAGGAVPLRCAAADLVLSTQVLEHVDRPAEHLAECARILRPGGRLLLSTHGLFPWHPDPVDHWRWTNSGLRAQVEEAGLEVTWFDGVVGLAAAGVQLFQYGTVNHLPRRLRQPYGRLLQRAVRWADRLDPEHRRYDAVYFVVVARRPA